MILRCEHIWNRCVGCMGLFLKDRSHLSYTKTTPVHMAPGLSWTLLFVL